jgi:hypothetical protein
MVGKFFLHKRAKPINSEDEEDEEDDEEYDEEISADYGEESNDESPKPNSK